MPQTYSVTCAWSCFQTPGKETTLSIILRVATIALGVVLAITGTLIIYGIPLSHFGTTEGLIAFSLGSLTIFVGTSTIKCIKIQRETDNSSAPNSENRFTVLQNQEVIFPSPVKRELKKGFLRFNNLNLEENDTLLETVITLARGKHPEIRKINLFPLCYKLQEEEGKITIDLSNHEEIMQSDILSVETEGHQFFTSLGTSIFQLLLLQGKPFKTTLQKAFAHFQTYAMPDVLFFTSTNGPLLEIGYINIHEILGRRVKFEVNDDNTITYAEIPLDEFSRSSSLSSFN